MTIKKHRRRGVVLSLIGQRKLDATRRQLEKTLNDGERFTLEELSARSQLAISTIARVLEARIGVDKLTLDHFFAAFDLLLERSDYQQPDDEESVLQPDLAPEPLRTDWGEGIDVANFYGRSTELVTLADWIATDGCRLVAILGMGGIGKTALSVKLAQTLVPNFEFIIWRSLRNAPPLATLLADLVPFLSNQQDDRNTLSRLIHYIQSHRCLVILDNLETLFQGESCAGQFRDGYADYGELLRSISESNHQSCVILTSREKPAEVATYEGENLPVRSLALGGSVEATQALLQAKGTIGTIAQKQVLGDLYGNSPLAVKIVATSIRDLFDGDIGQFLTEEKLVFNGVRRLLDKQFERLSELERSMMFWLAINREWTTVAELHADILPAVAKGKLLEALESLSWRSLIECKSSRYTLQPVVMEYITEMAIERVCTEFQTLQLDWLLQYALIKTTVKDYVRASQTRIILGAIGAQLSRTFGAILAIEQQATRVLSQLQTSIPNFADYGAGNLINLGNYLQIDLTGWDFSQLTIRQAYLQQTTLHQVNFTNANFVQSSFTQSFSKVVSVAFSPDGTQVATANTNSTVCLWRVTDSQPLLVLTGHTNRVQSAVFSPRLAIELPSGHRQLLASGSHDRTIKIWDANTGECLQTLHGHVEAVWALSWRSDGRMFASSSLDRTIKLWDLHTGECRHTLEGHLAMVFGVAWHPQLPLLASCSGDYTIKIWDTETGLCLHTLSSHEAGVLAVTWSPDGKVLASSGIDRVIKLWDVAAETCLKTLLGHASLVWSVAWSPDGRTIASSSQDRTIKLWDATLPWRDNTTAGKCLRTFQGHTDWIVSVNWSPDSQILASGSDDCTVRLWDLTGQCLRTLHGYAAQVFSLSWNPHHSILASGTQDGTVRLWQPDTGNCCDTFIGHTSCVWTVAWSPDGQMLASGSSDNTVRLWHRAGCCLHTFECDNSWVWSVTWSPDGQRLACSGDNIIKIWDVQTGTCLHTLLGHTDTIWTVAWSPDGRTLASSSSDLTVRLWDVATGACLANWIAHSGWIFTLAWSLDGQTLVSGANDAIVKSWHIPDPYLFTADTAPTCQVLAGHTNGIGSVAWHPDGKTLASSSSDLTLKLWDVATNTCVETLTGHDLWVRSLVWIQDGSILASASADTTIALWDVVTRSRVKTLRLDRPYEGTNITGVTGLTDGSIATLKSLGAIER
jgi:WD40 repeat protein